MAESSATTANKDSERSKDLEHQLTSQGQEGEHLTWWTCERLLANIFNCKEDTAWNAFICIMALIAIVWVAIAADSPLMDLMDVAYTAVYTLHVVSLGYSVYVETEPITWPTCISFLIDVLSYMHYALQFYRVRELKLICYYLRLHRPFKYLWDLNDYNMKGSILGTTLKYCYIFLVLRVTMALIWLQIEEDNQRYTVGSGWKRAYYEPGSGDYHPAVTLEDINVNKFLTAVYIVDKMFVPIGPSEPPANDVQRIACLVFMLIGCLVVSGLAVASLSLVISIYMRSEETFRTRFGLIMKNMKQSRVPISLSEKVHTFYKMYWLKQKGVSASRLLPKYPPWLSTVVYTDIYFKAMQKSRILRNLSYQFLSEVAKNMVTINYIPGDLIIKRSSTKSSIIYITYGDIEMLTAEDDSTALLRMTRGTELSPCAGCIPAACCRAHVGIRAATFCRAHVLGAVDLWRTAVRHGRTNGQAAIVLASFDEHLAKVKRHYRLKVPEISTYKSSIRAFKQNLMLLKEARDCDGNLLLERTAIMLEIAGSYIMRNRPDASLTDESDGICLRPTFPCILQPRSSLQMVWNTFVCCIILIVCVTHPYYLVYRTDVPIEFRFYDYVVTVVYVVDLFVHLSTGTNVEDGVPITLRQTSSQQVRSHWFALDVIAAAPVFEFIGDGRLAGINKLLRLPKVFRMLKSLEDEWVNYSNVLRFFSYSLLLLIACYLIAALKQGSMCFQFGHCALTHYTSPHWELKPQNDEWDDMRLAFGLFWAISMITFTCHMESGERSNWSNLFYTIIILELCIVLHIFMDSVYSATIMVKTALQENYDACVTDVKNFLIRNNLDPLLRQRFVTYLQLGWYSDKGFSMTNKNSIYHDLPPHVYQDIVNKQRSKYILCIPFMKYLNNEDLKMVSSKARIFYTSPNEILLNTGDISNEVYVIKQGICEVLDPESKLVVNEMRARSHFGVLECFLRLPSYYTVRAVTHVEMFSISRKHFWNAINIPQIKDAIKFAKLQPEYNRLQVPCQPFLTYKPPQSPPNKEYFRLPRKHEPDFAFLHPFYRLGFLSVLRYIFPRFTIRPDSDYLIRYEWFRAACAFFSSVLFPGYSYLQLQFPWLYLITLLLDVSAYFDIWQRMVIGYYNERGILVYHPVSTAAHYLKGAFIVDLLGCIPLENLDTEFRLQMSYRGKLRVASMRQVLMLNRLLQLYRTPSAIQGLAKYLRRDILFIIKGTPIFLALLNVVTCLMVFYSVDFYYSQQAGDWIIAPKSDTGNSWVLLFHDTLRFNLTESPWNMHLAVYFWVVYEATTTGYQSFNPSNLYLMRILFIGLVISAMITTYFSVRIISIRSNVNNALAAFQHHMRDMTAFMRRENLSPELQREVLEYYGYNWDKLGGLDYRYVLKLCDQITLRTDAILHIYGSTFEKCPILGHCDLSLLRIIGRAVHSVHLLQETMVIEKDDVITDVYFVDSGTVDIWDDETDPPTTLTLSKGSMFGDLNGDLSFRSTASLVTSSKVHLLRINSQVFHSIIGDFPEVISLLKTYRPNDESYVEGSIGEVTSKITTEPSPSTPVMMEHANALIKLLHYKNPKVQFYFITVSLLCLYVDVYNAGFQDNNASLVIWLYLLDFAFCLKFIIPFLLPYIAEEDLRTLLNQEKTIYFKKDFKFDILSMVPFELFSFLSDKHHDLLFSLLRLNRMFRVITVYKGLYRHHERLSINITLRTITSVFIWFTLFVHITSCLWFFIGFVEDAIQPKSSWIYDKSGKSWCDSVYICSLYFVVTTFTQNGVGDIIPRNQIEVLFVCLLMLISMMVFLIYVGEFSSIIQYQSYRSFGFYCKYLELQEFLKNNRVSKNLVNLVNGYSIHLWRESRGVQVPYLLKTAPQCLRLKIMSAAFQHHFIQHEVFKDCETAFLRQLVGCLRLYTYKKDMYVVRESEITDSMYFIHSGRVQESKEEDQKKVFYAGECFGVGLKHEAPYTHSYLTTTNSKILTLNLKDWEGLLKHFPASKATIYRNLNDDGNYPDDDESNKNHRKIKTTDDKDESDNRKDNFVEPKNSTSTDHEIETAVPTYVEKPVERLLNIFKFLKSLLTDSINEPPEPQILLTAINSDSENNTIHSAPTPTSLSSEKGKLNNKEEDKWTTHYERSFISNLNMKSLDELITERNKIDFLQEDKNTEAVILEETNENVKPALQDNRSKIGSNLEHVRENFSDDIQRSTEEHKKLINDNSKTLNIALTSSVSEVDHNLNAGSVEEYILDEDEDNKNTDKDKYKGIIESKDIPSTSHANRTNFYEVKEKSTESNIDVDENKKSNEKNVPTN